MGGGRALSQAVSQGTAAAGVAKAAAGGGALVPSAVIMVTFIEALLCTRHCVFCMYLINIKQLIEVRASYLGSRVRGDEFSE